MLAPCHPVIMLLVTAFPGASLLHVLQVLIFTEYDSTSNARLFPEVVIDETKMKICKKQNKTVLQRRSSPQKPVGQVKFIEQPSIQSQPFGQPTRPGKSKRVGSCVHSEMGLLSLAGCDDRIGNEN